jgi:hypothetical protein
MRFRRMRTDILCISMENDFDYPYNPILDILTIAMMGDYMRN